MTLPAVRMATPQDVPRLVGMARRFHAQVAPPWPLDEGRLAAVLRDMIGSQFVAVSDGGFLAGVKVPHPLSRWTVAKEFLWWAEDGSGGALRRAFRAWAADADEIQWSCPPGSRAERLYRRTATPIEIVYAEYRPCA